MGTHAVAFGGEKDGVAVQRKVGIAAHVAAIGEVDDVFASLCADQADVGVGVVLVTRELKCKPFTVRRPCVVKSSAGAVPGGAVRNLAHLLRLQIEHHQPDAVFDKGEFLAVGRELRIGTFHGGGGQQHFFFNQRGVREVRVFLAGYLGKVELPVAASLAGVGQGAVVRRKGEARFACRCVRHLLGSGIVCRSDKDFSAQREGNLFSVRGHNGRGDSVGRLQVGELRPVIAHQFYGDFLRGGIRLLGIDFAVVTVAQRPAVTHGEEAHGMCLEAGDGLHLSGLCQREGIHVE